MAGKYSHTVRSGTLTASQYNEDHQNHVDNALASAIDDYSADVAEMQMQTNPGGPGMESLPSTLAGEFERMRYVIAAMKGSTYWYETKTVGFAATTVLVFLQRAAPDGWTFLSSLADKVVRIATASNLGGATGGTWVISGLSMRHAHSWSDVGQTSTQSLVTGVAGPAGVGYAAAGHTHGNVSASGFTTTNTGTVSSTGAWRPAYIDALPCKKT